jgi:alpha-glucosidase
VSSDKHGWWQNAVIYEIYIRSFRDANGDGTGDLRGIIASLPYIRDLGVDAIWITPWYTSPMADGGYDVADFRDIAPEYGTLADADALLAEAHGLGLRVIIDLPANYSSIEHPWFQEALSSAPGSPARERYWFRDGRDDSEPNNWQSTFGGTAWERTADGQWYLHLYSAEQADFNWANEEVRSEIDSVLRYWFDRGVDGFRIDVAHGLSKDAELPDIPRQALGQPGALDPEEAAGARVLNHPHWDRDENHEIFRRWRRIADSYDDPRVFVAEAWRIKEGGLSDYIRPDELHNAFNFDFFNVHWNASEIAASIRKHLTLTSAVGAPATWVLGSHDITRVATRLSSDMEWTSRRLSGAVLDGDLILGQRRALALAGLLLALPGSFYIYQGEELGLPEVEDLPEAAIQDPIFARTGGLVRGRDGCRVPIPWDQTGEGLGFTSNTPWLPVPSEWASLSVAQQQQDPDSTLNRYRKMIALRREHLAQAPAFDLSTSPDGLITVDRGTIIVLTNCGERSADVPAGLRILFSTESASSTIQPGATVWAAR